MQPYISTHTHGKGVLLALAMAGAFGPHELHAQAALAPEPLAPELSAAALARRQAAEAQSQAVVLNAAAELTAAANAKKKADFESRKLDLEQEAALADLQAKIAKSNKEIREASFGDTTKPLAGTVETESSAEILVITTHQMSQIAKVVVNDMISQCRPANGKKIILVPGNPDQESQAAMRSYDTILKNIRSLNGLVADLNKRIGQYEKPAASRAAEDSRLESNAIASLAGAANVLQGVLSIATLARVNRKFTGATISINDSALVAATAGHLIDKRPGLHVHSTGLTTIREPLLEELAALSELRINLEALQAKLPEDSEKADKDGEEESVAAISEAIEQAEVDLTNTQKAIEGDEKALDAEQDAGEKAKLKGRIEANRDAVALHKERLEFLRERHAAAQVIGSSDEDGKKLKQESAVLLTRAKEVLDGAAKGTVSGVALPELFGAGRLINGLGAGDLMIFLKVNQAEGTKLARQTLLSNSFRAAGGISISYQAVDHTFRTVGARTYYDHEGFFKVRDKVIGDLPSNLPNKQTNDDDRDSLRSPSSSKKDPFHRSGPRRRYR